MGEHTERLLMAAELDENFWAVSRLASLGEVSLLYFLPINNVHIYINL